MTAAYAKSARVIGETSSERPRRAQVTDYLSMQSALDEKIKQHAVRFVA